MEDLYKLTTYAGFNPTTIVPFTIEGFISKITIQINKIKKYDIPGKLKKCIKLTPSTSMIVSIYHPNTIKDIMNIDVPMNMNDELIE